MIRTVMRILPKLRLLRAAARSGHRAGLTYMHN